MRLRANFMHLTPDKEAAVSQPVCCRQRLACSHPLIPTIISANMFCKYHQIRVSENEAAGWLGQR